MLRMDYNPNDHKRVMDEIRQLVNFPMDYERLTFLGWLHAGGCDIPDSIKAVYRDRYGIHWRDRPLAHLGDYWPDCLRILGDFLGEHPGVGENIEEILA